MVEENKIVEGDADEVPTKASAVGSAGVGGGERAASRTVANGGPSAAQVKAKPGEASGRKLSFDAFAPAMGRPLPPLHKAGPGDFESWLTEGDMNDRDKHPEGRGVAASRLNTVMAQARAKRPVANAAQASAPHPAGQQASNPASPVAHPAQQPQAEGPARQTVIDSSANLPLPVPIPTIGMPGAIPAGGVGAEAVGGQAAPGQGQPVTSVPGATVGGVPAAGTPGMGGVPFTVICPEGYLPVIKFVKIPERAPRTSPDVAYQGLDYEPTPAPAPSPDAASGATAEASGVDDRANEDR